MNSQLVLTFNASDLPILGEGITIRDTIGISLPISTDYVFEYVSSPAGAGQLSVPSTLSQAMFDFVVNFNNFYNTGLVYNVVADYNASTITITSNNPVSSFSVPANPALPAITTNITNNQTEPITITGATGQTANNQPCNNINIAVTTSVVATSSLSPQSNILNSDSFTFVDVARANLITINVIDAEGNLASRSVRAPLLLREYFDVSVNQTPAGNSINITRLFPLTQAGQGLLLLSFEYSFDGGVTWGQNSGISGIADGTYDIAIRDNLGCQIDFEVVIEEYDPFVAEEYDPVAEISNINPIRFKEDVVWENCGVLRTPYNTLSHEENVKINDRNFQQIFQTCDSITTQVKTNYANITATITDCENNVSVLEPVQMTENMNRIDVRDSRLFYDNGFLAVSFYGGNTYNTQGQITGSYFPITEGLSWLDENEYILIEGYGWGQITDILPPSDDSIYFYYRTNIQLGSVIAPVTSKTTSYYNAVDYERYELTIPANSLAEGNYQLKIVFSDPNPEVDNKTFISEWISIKEDWSLERPHHVIEYYNSENNDINFATGVQFKLRVPYLRNLKWSPETEQEVFITDTRATTIENKARDLFNMMLKPMPTAMAQKLMLILSQDRLKIDGMTFTLSSEVESNSLGETNLYTLNASLYKSDYVFENYNGNTTGEILIPSVRPLAVDDDAEGLLLI